MQRKSIFLKKTNVTEIKEKNRNFCYIVIYNNKKETEEIRTRKWNIQVEKEKIGENSNKRKVTEQIIKSVSEKKGQLKFRGRCREKIR